MKKKILKKKETIRISHPYGSNGLTHMDCRFVTHTDCRSVWTIRIDDPYEVFPEKCHFFFKGRRRITVVWELEEEEESQGTTTNTTMIGRRNIVGRGRRTRSARGRGRRTVIGRGRRTRRILKIQVPNLMKLFLKD